MTQTLELVQDGTRAITEDEHFAQMIAHLKAAEVHAKEIGLTAPGGQIYPIGLTGPAPEVVRRHAKVERRADGDNTVIETWYADGFHVYTRVPRSEALAAEIAELETTLGDKRASLEDLHKR